MCWCSWTTGNLTCFIPRHSLPSFHLRPKEMVSSSCSRGVAPWKKSTRNIRRVRVCLISQHMPFMFLAHELCFFPQEKKQTTWENTQCLSQINMTWTSPKKTQQLPSSPLNASPFPREPKGFIPICSATTFVTKGNFVSFWAFHPKGPKLDIKTPELEKPRMGWQFLVRDGKWR